MPDITPDYVLSLESPAKGYLCPMEANRFGIEFLRFEIKDFNSGRVVYSSVSEGRVSMQVSPEDDCDLCSMPSPGIRALMHPLKNCDTLGPQMRMRCVQ